MIVGCIRLHPWCLIVRLWPYSLPWNCVGHNPSKVSMLVQVRVQGLYYLASAQQLVCFSCDAALTTLAEDGEGSQQWKVLTTMRFSFSSRRKSQEGAGTDAAGRTAADQLLVCWTGAIFGTVDMPLGSALLCRSELPSPELSVDFA